MRLYEGLILSVGPPPHKKQKKKIKFIFHKITSYQGYNKYIIDDG